LREENSGSILEQKESQHTNNIQLCQGSGSPAASSTKLFFLLSLSLSLCLFQRNRDTQKLAILRPKRQQRAKRIKKPILALSILVLLLVEEATGHSIEKKLSEFQKKKIN
jgi:cell division protein ZapA (FtsZ GTPase activity inhibitor)